MTHSHTLTNDSQKRNILKHERTITYKHDLNDTNIDNNRHTIIYTLTYTMILKRTNQKTYKKNKND